MKKFIVSYTESSGWYVDGSAIPTKKSSVNFSKNYKTDDLICVYDKTEHLKIIVNVFKTKKAQMIILSDDTVIKTFNIKIFDNGAPDEIKGELGIVIKEDDISSSFIYFKTDDFKNILNELGIDRVQTHPNKNETFLEKGNMWTVITAPNAVITKAPEGIIEKTNNTISAGKNSVFCFEFPPEKNKWLIINIGGSNILYTNGMITNEMEKEIKSQEEYKK